MKISLPPLWGQYPKNADEAHALALALDRLDVPASRQWIAQRVVTLLTHYYVIDVHPAAMKAVAKDWTREVSNYPEWAIEAACAWWIGRHNPKRDKKPMPGDISERAEKEIACIALGRMQIDWYKRHGDNPPEFLRRIATMPRPVSEQQARGRAANGH